MRLTFLLRAGRRNGKQSLPATVSPSTKATNASLRTAHTATPVLPPGAHTDTRGLNTMVKTAQATGRGRRATLPTPLNPGVLDNLLDKFVNKD